jgi:hypothetical protein
VRSILAPTDDVVIPCEVRLWEERSVTVFVHPREWARVSLWGGVPMWVTCHGVDFACEVFSGGEFYRSGNPKDLHPRDFDLPGHGDYAAQARIDWDEAIPDLVLAGIRSDPKLAERWKLLPLDEMRSRLNYVLRANKASSRTERSLNLLAELAGSSAEKPL